MACGEKVPRLQRVLSFGTVVGLLVTLSAASSPVYAQSGSALTHYTRGERLYEAGDLAGAQKAFEQAYALDPRAHRGDRVGMHFEDYDPAFALGRVHARLGNFEEAEKFFRECAASGYTARSQNAEEFRRWRAVVERAVSAARDRAASMPPQPAPRPPEPTPTGPPEPEATVIPREPAPATPVSVALVSPRPTPPGIRTVLSAPTPSAPDIDALPLAFPTSPPTGRLERPSSPAAPTGGASRPHPTGAALRERGTRPFLLALAAATLGVLLLLLRRFARRGHRMRVGEGTVPFGRYVITGLLGSGRTSFVYDARERRSGQPVALRIRRPDRPLGETERFSREAAALERIRRSSSDVPAPKVLSHGVEKTGDSSLEYLALERLSGRTLLSLSRNAGKRLDPVLSVEILREIAAALRRVRAHGLAHDDLAAEDVFLMDPVPVNAANPIHLKLLGLCAGAADPDRDAAALAAIATELFRGRAASWEKDEWVSQHIPATLREALIRARSPAGEPGVSFDEVEKALIEATKGFRIEASDAP